MPPEETRRTLNRRPPGVASLPSRAASAKLESAAVERTDLVMHAGSARPHVSLPISRLVSGRHILYCLCAVVPSQVESLVALFAVPFVPLHRSINRFGLHVLPCPAYRFFS